MCSRPGHPIGMIGGANGQKEQQEMRRTAETASGCGRESMWVQVSCSSPSALIEILTPSAVFLRSPAICMR